MERIVPSLPAASIACSTSSTLRCSWRRAGLQHVQPLLHPFQFLERPVLLPAERLVRVPVRQRQVRARFDEQVGDRVLGHARTLAVAVLDVGAVTAPTAAAVAPFGQEAGGEHGQTVDGVA